MTAATNSCQPSCHKSRNLTTIAVVPLLQLCSPRGIATRHSFTEGTAMSASCTVCAGNSHRVMLCQVTKPNNCVGTVHPKAAITTPQTAPVRTLVSLCSQLTKPGKTPSEKQDYTATAATAQSCCSRVSDCVGHCCEPLQLPVHACPCPSHFGYGGSRHTLVIGLARVVRVLFCL